MSLTPFIILFLSSFGSLLKLSLKCSSMCLFNVFSNLIATEDINVDIVASLDEDLSAIVLEHQGGDPLGIKTNIRLESPIGYQTSSGVKNNGDFWRISINYKDSLLRLFKKLEPYLKHKKRVRDMEKAKKIEHSKTIMVKAIRFIGYLTSPI